MTELMAKHIRECPGCSGDSKNAYAHIPEELMSQMSPEKLDLVKQMYDPLYWAKKHLRKRHGGFEPRASHPDLVEFLREDDRLFYEYGEEEEYWEAMFRDPDYSYQAHLIQCNHPRMYVRAGRRLGKTISLSVKILHKIFFNSNYKVTIFTPDKAQLQLIIGDQQGSGMINFLIDGNPNLKPPRHIGSPYPKIEFTNGSSIAGFVSGSTAVHGQAANFLILDEAAYLTANDIESVIFLLQEDPNTILWASSTPSPAANWFRERSTDERYRRYFFPSQFNPYWADINTATGLTMEEDLKQEVETASAYDRQALALFADDKDGVFRQKHLDIAFGTDYTSEYFKSPEFLKVKHSWHFVMGVDWNGGNVGTRIAVVGTPDFKQFYLVDLDKVATKHWTQRRALLRIIAKNEEWSPDYIYADAGYGETNIENLKAAGFASPGTPTAKIPRILHSVDVSKFVEVYDPFEQAKIKKPFKGFMVNNAIRFFEKSQIIIPKEHKILRKELNSYAILRVTPQRNLIFGIPKALEKKVRDDDLDALMLALLGFTLQFTIFGSPKPVIGAHALVNPFTQAIPAVPGSLEPGKVSVRNIKLSRELHDDEDTAEEIQNKDKKDTFVTKGVPLRIFGRGGRGIAPKRRSF